MTGPEPDATLADGDAPDPWERGLSAGFQGRQFANPESDAEIVPAAEVRTRRYLIRGEIARGGLGVILEAQDLEIGREVALKVLRDDRLDRPDLLRRLLQEARICGQLQHPGIVPVYDAGLLGPRRPYIAMKLVRGQTLQALLRDREDGEEDRPRYLAIFEKVAQTVAYAHSRGVIHRDLKPANIMVGDFGEVQVMDWGAAKVLGPGMEVARPAADAMPGPFPMPLPGPGGLESLPGSVVGTYAYMAPEQARGEAALLDERADVFGLGAILCEILTGRPAYDGKDLEELGRSARAAATEGALRRLDSCRGDSELIVLAKRCLAADRGARPRDAGELASHFSAYLASVAERLHAADLAAAEARARAQEERRARRLTMALAATLVLGLLIAGSAWILFQKSSADRAAETRVALSAASERARSSRAEAERAGAAALLPWEEALAAAREAEAVARAGTAAESTRRDVSAFRAEVEELRNRAREAAAQRVRNAAMVDRLEEIRSWDREPARSFAAFTAAFRDFGIDLTTQDDAEIIRRVQDCAIFPDLAAALDGWALDARRLEHPDPGLRARLDSLALAADTDRERRAIRQAFARGDADALSRLASDPDAAARPVPTVLLFSSGLRFLGKTDEARTLLDGAWSHRPNDFWINLRLGELLHATRQPGAERYFATATALRPTGYTGWNNLANTLDDAGRHDEAIEHFRRAVALRPDHATLHNNLGAALFKRGQVEEAIDAYDAALRLEPDLAVAHSNLGHAFSRRQDWTGALIHYRRATELIPTRAAFWVDLARALRKTGDKDGAIAANREALRREPDNKKALNDLGGLLRSQGLYHEAIDPLRRAVAQDPNEPFAALNLATCLIEVWDLEGAFKILSEARLRWPENPDVLLLLGRAHLRRSESTSAEAFLHESLRLRPEDAATLCNLGHALELQGRHEEALDAFERGHALGRRTLEWKHSSGEWVDRCRRTLRLASLLDRFLSGEEVPRSREDAIAVARLCRHRERPAAAARFYLEALECTENEDPTETANLLSEAAAAAVLAATGENGAETVDETARTAWRRQALEWLRDGLRTWTTAADMDSRLGHCSREALQIWLRRVDLAPVRDDTAMPLLPENERALWQDLWSEVAKIISRTGG